jgi:ADP-ribose pyrophosphatase YjhB (NUDIX family)
MKDSTVIGAGIILYRPTLKRSRPVEIALVRSKKNGTWGFPKGKRNKLTERLEYGARRELKEETGLCCTTLFELGTTFYTTTKGKSKAVKYWLGESAGPAPFTFEDSATHFQKHTHTVVEQPSNSEIDQVRWCTPREVISTLSAVHDILFFKKVIAANYCFKSSHPTTVSNPTTNFISTSPRNSHLDTYYWAEASSTNKKLKHCRIVTKKLNKLKKLDVNITLYLVFRDWGLNHKQAKILSKLKINPHIFFSLVKLGEAAEINITTVVKDIIIRNQNSP